MKWQEKWAVLKMAGFELKDHGDDRAVGMGKYFRYVCQEHAWGKIYGAGDTKAEAVNSVWEQYIEEKQNEKVS